LCFFYQSDVVNDGVWVDKAALVQDVARREGVAELWHGIVCRKPVGTRSFGRATYSHLLCFSRNVRGLHGRGRADVMLAGEMTWVRAMGVTACREACKLILSSTKSHTVVDPFCGMGTVLAIANQMGLHSVGVEKNQKRAAQARALHIAEDVNGDQREARRRAVPATRGAGTAPKSGLNSKSQNHAE
jgi:hypothetical protein